MIPVVKNQAGEPLPDANWGNLDFEGINLEEYPNVDLSREITIAGGLTGPRYVRVGDDIVDLETRWSARPRKNPEGYPARQAEIDEEQRIVWEQRSQR